MGNEFSRIRSEINLVRMQTGGRFALYSWYGYATNVCCCISNCKPLLLSTQTPIPIEKCQCCNAIVHNFLNEENKLLMCDHFYKWMANCLNKIFVEFLWNWLESNKSKQKVEVLDDSVHSVWVLSFLNKIKLIHWNGGNSRYFSLPFSFYFKKS